EQSHRSRVPHGERSFHRFFSSASLDLPPLDEIPLRRWRARDVFATALHIEQTWAIAWVELGRGHEILQRELEGAVAICVQPAVVVFDYFTPLAEIFSGESEKLVDCHGLCLADHSQ